MAPQQWSDILKCFLSQYSPHSDKFHLLTLYQDQAHGLASQFTEKMGADKKSFFLLYLPTYLISNHVFFSHLFCINKSICIIQGMIRDPEKQEINN